MAEAGLTGPLPVLCAGMRLLVINWFDWTHPLWGGAEVYLREVFRRLAARGHDVTLLCSTYAGCCPDSTEAGVHIRRRGGFWTFHLEVPWFYHRELAGQRWDCVFEYTNKIPMLTPLYVRAPIVAVAHHLFGTTIFQESRPPIAAYVYLMERLLPAFYRRTRWVAVSPSTRRELVARGIPAANVSVVPNGIDTSWYQPAAGPPHPATTPGYAVGGTVVWIGRMKRYKQVDVLLRAMPRLRAQVPGVKLALAGHGPDAGRLRALVERLRLTSAEVSFLGAVSEVDKLRLLQQAAVLAQPSAKEGWGRTVLEAGACGVPAVASDVAGLRDSVVHGETGLLVPPGDSAALALALASLLQDRARRVALGQAARVWAQRFTWDAAADATERLAEALSAPAPVAAGAPAGAS